MTTTFNPLEKRRHPRRIVRERYAVAVYTEEILATSGEPIPGIVTDISISGLGIILDAPVPGNMKVIIELNGRYIQGKLQCRVAWCGKLPSAGRVIKVRSNSSSWRVGLEIVPRSPDESKFLESIVKML